MNRYVIVRLYFIKLIYLDDFIQRSRH